MRNWLLIPLLLLLTGCVTYYYPALESQEGVYYADEQPRYIERVHTDYSVDFTSARYYPWWSMDYFYLGSGYYDYGYSIGFSFGYPRHRHYYPYFGYRWFPYYYPSWYYDPWHYSYWYAPVHYHYSYFGFPYHNPYWHARYRDYHYRHHYAHDDYRHRFDRRGNRYQDRWNDPNPGLNPPRDYETGRPVGDDPARRGAMSRRVAVAPSNGPSDRGMEVRSRENAKRRISRTEPVSSIPVPVAPAKPADRSDRVVREPSHRYSTARRESEQVRYYPESKQRTSRTGPVASREPSPSISTRVQVPRQPDAARRATADSRRGDMTVRSPSQGKTGKSRVQPVQPATSPRIQVPRSVRVNPPPRSAPPQRSAPVKRAAPPRTTPVQRSAPRYSPRPAVTPRASASPKTRASAVSAPKPRDRDRD